MSDNTNKITIKELKTYLYSLDDEETKEELNQINIYKDECEKKQKEVKTKDIEWIQKVVSEEYERRNQTKDKILSLLNECERIPKDIEKLEVSRYMLYRVDIIRAEKILTKVIKRLGKRYKEILLQVLELMEIYPTLDYVKEIDSSIYKTNSDALEKAKKEFVEEYTDEQRMELIKKELDIIQKSKVFNSIPIPHEILKNSDREIQSKMQKFNNIRQKRIIMLSTMEADYIKLMDPREINQMIDDALLSIEGISDILTEAEYKRITKKLIRRRKRIYRSTSEIRSIIKYKEKKTGIINYNIQEARYGRMEVLRNKISEASKIVQMNDTSKVEEKLKRIKSTYEKEKQFASIIENIESDETINDSQNIEILKLKEQIDGLEKRIQNSESIIKDQEKIIEDAKKELLILWKIEIDNTISNKKEDILELAESNDYNRKFETEKKAFLGLNKIRKAKHEVA